MPKLIVANWKDYLMPRQSAVLARRISNFKSPISKSRIVICPGFLALNEVAKTVRGTQIKIGAQDVWPESRGAFTGEIGLDDLAELGVEYVLIGHSERRQYQGESDVLVNKKLRATLQAGMKPILCVGESWSMRKQGAAQKYVNKQLRLGLKGVTPKDLQRVVVAYEPIWAIGTGRPAKPEDAEVMHAFIRATLSKLSFVQRNRTKLSFSGLSILYGGSVNGENAGAFLKTKGVDGLLVGGASTKAEELKRILFSC